MSPPPSKSRPPTDNEAFAERLWRWSIDAGTADAALYRNLGRLLESQRRDLEAEEAYRAALTLDPLAIDAELSLGEFFMKHQRDDEAEFCFRRILERSPTLAAAHCDLGLVLARSTRLEEAEASYRKAIAIEPESVAAHTNLGLLLEAVHRDQDAEEFHRKALALDAEASEVHSNLGNLLARLGRYAEAEQCHLKAFALEPESAAVLSNLGVLLSDCRRDVDAEECLRAAIALQPDYALAKLNLGYVLLAQGRYAEAWLPHDARNDPNLPMHGKPPPTKATLPWNGEPLEGKSILVWAEQGRGDQIQFCRYVSLLKAAGASHITLACYAELAPVLQTLEAVDLVLPAKVEGRSFVVEDGVREHDYWAYPMSLPRLLQPDAAQPLAELPYLFASAERIEKWSLPVAEAPGARPFRVGLIWRGNRRHNNDADRSLPSLSTLAPLWPMEGVEFISLQVGADGAEIEAAQGKVRHLGDALSDFADTAAILAQIDLLISVDTAAAHLAGAMARPCFLLLPFHRSDWRWLHHREDSPWYPGVMRIFRQPARGDWGSVMSALRSALQELVVKRIGTVA